MQELLWVTAVECTRNTIHYLQNDKL